MEGTPFISGFLSELRKFSAKFQINFHCSLARVNRLLLVFPFKRSCTVALESFGALEVLKNNVLSFFEVRLG